MKKILFILITLCLCSCYHIIDLNTYPDNDKGIDNSKEDFYWYYNKELFTNVDSCYIVGTLKNEYNDIDYSINHQCSVYNDTVYVIKKYIANKNNILDGVIYIKDREPYRIITTLL